MELVNLEEINQLLESKMPNGKLLFGVVRGSHSYGTNIPESDIDYGGVYIQSNDDILSDNYTPYISDEKGDTTLYELKRFLELGKESNPNILEIINTPDDCILYIDEVFKKHIIDIKDKFVSKECFKAFSGYAMKQIKKAKGMNKKQNWEENKIKRKDILDFCYIVNSEYGSYPLKKYLSENELKQENCGVSKVPNFRDAFLLFYSKDIGYKGIVKSNDGVSKSESTELRLSSIPKGEEYLSIMGFNKDGYISHCKDFREYTKWLTDRNEKRWVDVKTHKQSIDGKNMMHCVRLSQLSKDIALTGNIKIRRDNVEELLSIRKGEVDLQSIIDNISSILSETSTLFEQSDIREVVDLDTKEILLKVRKRLG